MADSKISALTDGGNLQGADQVAINRGGTSFRAVALQDGWIDDTAETWSYASGSGGGTATFTIAGVDLTAKYTVGTRIKLTQTTVKYFTVIAVSFSTNTTVTITAGSDYTLANAAISVNYHSYAANPQGYPTWFNCNLAPTGFSGTPTQTVAKFRVTGREMCLLFNVTGTSNTTAFGLTTPVSVVDALSYPIRVTDATTAQVNPGRASTSAASTTLTLSKDLTGATWTNSGTKAALGMIVTAI